MLTREPSLQPRVHHRAGFVDAPPDRRGDALADVRQMLRCRGIGRCDSITLPLRSTKVFSGPFTMMSVMVSSSSNGSSGPSPRMSSTSSPASARCSRRVELDAPFGGDLRDQPFHVGGQPVRRHGGDRGGIQPRQADVAQFDDRFFRRAAHGHERAAATAAARFLGARSDPAAAGPAAWTCGGRRTDRVLMAYAGTGSSRCGCPKRGAPTAACGGIQQADEGDLARQFVHASAEAAGLMPSPVRRASRRCRPGAAGREWRCPPSSSAHLPPACASGRRECRGGSAPRWRVAVAPAPPGSASKRSVSRTAARVGSITSTRWSTRSSRSRYSGTGAKGTSATMKL